MSYEPKERFVILVEGEDGKWYGEYPDASGPMSSGSSYEWSTLWGRLPTLESLESASKAMARFAQGGRRGYGPVPKGKVHLYEVQFKEVTPINIKDVLRRAALEKLTPEEKEALGV